MKWFDRFLLMFMSLGSFLAALYGLAWLSMGEPWVEGFLATYYLPTHQTALMWQKCAVLLLLLILWVACAYAVLKSIRFENTIVCKPIRGGDLVLLTDRAIKRTVLKAIGRIPQVAKATADVTNVFGGGIVVKIYVLVHAGESIPDVSDETKRRTRQVFEKVLGVKNLSNVKVIVKGLKFKKDSERKLIQATDRPDEARAAAAPARPKPPQ